MIQISGSNQGRRAKPPKSPKFGLFELFSLLLGQRRIWNIVIVSGKTEVETTSSNFIGEEFQLKNFEVTKSTSQHDIDYSC